ncbi:MAG: hypothetical protein KAJ51_12905 [Thermoplasmata archaeon]|nr:hypothetical protein [Thermoplasmata archaeon]
MRAIQEPENGLDSTPKEITKPLGEEDYYWDIIEIISEPIPGQNINVGHSLMPSIAVENGYVYVTWGDANNTNGAGSSDIDIFLRYHDGNEWSDTEVVSEPSYGMNINTGVSSNPDIAVENDKVHIVWFDDNNTNYSGNDKDIFYRYFDGNSWLKIEVISEPIFGANMNVQNSLDPAIEVENSNVHVVWMDSYEINGCGNDGDIKYRCFDGSTWSDIEVISEPIVGKNTNIESSLKPDIAVENGKIYVVWYDENNTKSSGMDWDIFYRFYEGNKWLDIEVISEPLEGKNNNINGSTGPTISVENGKVSVVWIDFNDTNGAGNDPDIFFRYFDGSNWLNIEVISEPTIGKDNNIGVSNWPVVASEYEEVYVIWFDTNNTNGAGNDLDIFYRHYNGYKWSEIEVISEPVVGSDNNILLSRYPAIAVEKGKVYATWEDNNFTYNSGTDHDIFYRVNYAGLKLVNGKVTPLIGYSNTSFNYTVEYINIENQPPIYINVNINGLNYSMEEVNVSDANYIDGKKYFYNNLKFDIIDTYTFRFYASDGIHNVSTPLIDAPNVLNSPPIIISTDNFTIYEDVYYEVDYDYFDIDIDQMHEWNFNSNASWLAFNTTTGVLNGTPLNDDIGKYWVNVTINDTIDIDFTNFTLTVIDVNDDPIINISNTEVAYEDELYFVDYNATDVDSPIENQIWSLNTNATSWLEIDMDSGTLCGTPSNTEVGSYWVNVFVNDTEGGIDFENFTLIVLNVNDPPIIITEDLTNARVANLYEVDYEATDIDSPLPNQKWSLTTNATWLKIEPDTGILSGTPALSDLGWYNINVTVNDGDGGLDWHEFLLSVTGGIINKPPIITTIDVLYATINESYFVDYDAIDDRIPTDKLSWAIVTNASWLKLEPTTGVLSGTPTEMDVGKYWVNISVSDGEGGAAYHNFTITVTKSSIKPPPIPSNSAPDLINGKVSPSEGNTETEFTFSVQYYDADNDSPIFIQVIIDNNSYDMTLKTGQASNGTYEYKTNLSEGNHTFNFIASDGTVTVSTENFTTPYIEKPEGKESQELSFWGWFILIIILVVIIVLIASILLIRARMKREEKLLLTAEQELEMGMQSKENIQQISPPTPTYQLLQPPPLAQPLQPEQTIPKGQLMEEDEVLEE